jgi:hypothetical protein
VTGAICATFIWTRSEEILTQAEKILKRHANEYLDSEEVCINTRRATPPCAAGARCVHDLPLAHQAAEKRRKEGETDYFERLRLIEEKLKNRSKKREAPSDHAPTHPRRPSCVVSEHLRLRPLTARLGGGAGLLCCSQRNRTRQTTRSLASRTLRPRRPPRCKLRRSLRHLQHRSLLHLTSRIWIREQEFLCVDDITRNACTFLPCATKNNVRDWGIWCSLATGH